MGNKHTAKGLQAVRSLDANAGRLRIHDVEDESAVACDAGEQSGAHRIPAMVQDARQARVCRCGGHGDPLVLVHPFALCNEVWKPILPALEQHHEVFALSLPGHLGADPVPQDYSHTVESAVDLLEKKLDAMGISQAHIVGNSLGGWFAIELARRGRALSVVALAPGGGWEEGSPHVQRLHRHFKMTHALLRLGGQVALRLVQWPTARYLFLRDCVARPHSLSPDAARLMIEAAYRCEAYEDVMNAIPTQTLSAPFQELPCPVRLVWGAEDRLLPINGFSERWRRILPGAEWVVLPDVGHVPMFDDPDAVSASILDVTMREREDARMAG